MRHHLVNGYEKGWDDDGHCLQQIVPRIGGLQGLKTKIAIAVAADVSFTAKVTTVCLANHPLRRIQH